MKSVTLNIISSAKIYSPTKIDNLDEKRLAPNMMMRRRLTRNSRIMLYLADKCGFKNGKIVFGSCFSEIEETAKIANAILEENMISPTSFQNSVYNTAPSYFSLINKDTDEIITVSNGMKTSLDALKTAALQALISGEKVLCICSECINIKNIEEVNKCANFLEAGVAVVIEIAKGESEAKAIEPLHVKGVIDSLKDLTGVVNMHENGCEKIKVEL